MNNFNLQKQKNSNWFVVKTMPNSEKKVHDRLMSNNFTSFLPIYGIVRQWSDRKKKVYRPLISSVVFVTCEIAELPKIYSVIGTNGILNYLGKPAVVKNYEIDNLRIVMNEWGENLVEICTDSVEEGIAVEVVRGPFKGLIATSITMNGNHRVIVKIDSLGSNFVVNVPRSFLKKLNKVAA